jgi:hypothetical protein
MTVAAAPWRVRPGLETLDGRLTIAGHDAEELGRQHGTPLFAYDLARYGENARAWQAAFAATGIPFRLRFALKANPLPEVLAVFRALGEAGSAESVGIDACSPGEVVRDRVRLATRRDQLHGDERLGAGPGRPVGIRHPPQPRGDQPGRAVRAASPGNADRHPH